MKLTIFLIFFYLLQITDVTAQFSFGVTGGVNIANSVNGKFPDANVVMLVKPQSLLFSFLGVVPGYRFNDKWKILLEVQYSHKGQRVYKPGVIDISYRYSYVDIMPQIEYTLFPHAVVGAGLYYGIRTKELVRVGDQDWEEFDIVELVDATDAGVLASVKWEPSQFFLVGRYSRGLKNISQVFYTDINGQIQDGPGQWNSVMQVGLGYIFK